MTEKNKKIVLYVLFAGACVLIAAAIWFVFFREKPTAPVPRPAAAVLPEAGTLARLEGAPGARPSAVITELPVSAVAVGGITQTQVLNFSGSVAATASQDGKGVNFLNANDGRFYRITPDGQTVQMSDKQFFNVEKVHWSPQKTETIMEFPDGSNVFFDFDRQRQVTLPRHWEEFDFAPDGKGIAALSLGTDTDNRWLITASPDGSDARALEPLGRNADKVTVSWAPHDQVVAFSNTGEATGGQTRNMLLIGKNGENFPALRVDGTGFLPNWSPSGQSLLYSASHSSDEWNPRLWIAQAQGDAIGAGKTDLGLNTWADKCTFSDERTLYCAVPDRLEPGLGLEPSLAKFIPDTIYKVDVTTGSKTVVGKPTAPISMQNLVADSTQGALFFTDASTGALHKMRLQ